MTVLAAMMLVSWGFVFITPPLMQIQPEMSAEGIRAFSWIFYASVAIGVATLVVLGAHLSAAARRATARI